MIFSSWANKSRSESMSCNSVIIVKTMNDIQNTDTSQWPGLNLFSSTTGLREERHTKSYCTSKRQISSRIFRCKKDKKETLKWQNGYSLRPPTSSDLNAMRHGEGSSGCISTFQVSSKSADVRGQNLPSRSAVVMGLYNSLHCYASRYEATVSMASAAP